MCLIESYEAIERNEEVANESHPKDEMKKKSKNKNRKSKTHSKKGGEKSSAGGNHKYYCSEQSHNSLHDTMDCWT